jgi:hypothetical protein
MKSKYAFAAIVLEFGLAFASVFNVTKASGQIQGQDVIHLEKSIDSGSEWRLDVRGQPLDKVLKKLTNVAGLPIHYSVLPEGLVTATCVGETLKQVMECLLDKRADLVVRYLNANGKSKQVLASARNDPVEMWVLGSRYSGEGICPSSNNSPYVVSNSPANPHKEDDGTDEAEPDQVTLYLEMAKSQDAAVRADGIGALLSVETTDDRAIKAIVQDALHDPNAKVRAQAISTWAHREGEDATAALQEALHDEDAGVRLMATDVAGNNAALLQQAVNDKDQTVRDLATSKLEELQQKVQ